MLADNPFLMLAQARVRRQPRVRRWLETLGGPLLILLGPLVAARAAGLPTGPALAFTAFLAILATALRTGTATALAVVGERQRGTLASLALTRVTSADYADGVVLGSTAPTLGAMLILSPLALALGCLGGADPLASLSALGICFMVGGLAAYHGLGISATSRSAHEACWRVWTQTLSFFLLSPILFVAGGFAAYPLWLMHPYAALSLALWGATSPGPYGTGLLILRWYALLFVPLAALLLRALRRQVILKLERLALT